MARTLSSDNNLVYPSNYNGTAPVTTPPATLAAWARFSATSVQHVMFCATSGAEWFGLTMGYTTAGRVGASLSVTAGESLAETTTGITINQWHHCCAVFTSATSRTAYIDGGSAGSNTTSRAPTGAVNISIGSFRLPAGTQYGPLSGQVAEAAIWNVALTASEIAALARGITPNLIRPDSLAGYWPLYGLLSPEPDAQPGILSATRRPMTLIGTPAKYDNHAPVIYSFPSWSVPVIGTVTTSTTSLAPDSIAASSNLTGVLASIQDDPDSPDANWLTATSATAATDLRVTFPTPDGDPSGSQDFKLWLRKTTGSPNPTVTVELRETDTLRSTVIAAGTEVSSTTGQLLTGPWNSTDLVTDTTGGVVECRVVSVTGDSSTVGAMPAYDATGQATYDGSATITATINPAKPSTVNAGDLLILQVLARNDNTDGAGPATITDWTPFAGNTYGGVLAARQALYWRIAGAGEASQTVGLACTGGTTADLAMARIYRFTAANGFAANPIEGITTNTGTASPMLAPVTGATPGGTNRLAVCMGAIASSDATIGSMTGETAGNWAEVASVNTITGGDGTLNVQTADASAGTAISGGSIAFTATTSGNWNTVAFYLVPGSSSTAVNTVEVGAIEWNAQYITPTGANIQPALAPVIVSGTAPSLSIILAPAIGAVSVAGNAPTINVFKYITVPSAAPVVSAGLAPSITVTRFLAPALAQVSITGIQPSILLEVSAATASFTIAGNAPAITIIIVPAIAVVSITGNAPAITNILSATLGPIVATGPPISLATVLNGASGGIAIVGGIPTPVHILNPALAAVDVSGAAPELILTQNLQPDSGVVTVSGNAPSLGALVTIELQPSVGPISLDGMVPALSTSYAPDSAAVTLSGGVPGLGELVPVILEASSGAVAATGLSPCILTDLVGSAAVVSISGNAPAVDIFVTVSLEANTGAIVVSGSEPAIVSAFAPPTATVTVSGGIPGLGELVPIVLEPASAVVSASGVAPALYVELVPSPAQVTLDGLAPTVESTFSPVTGIISASGLAPTISTSLAPSSGAIEFAGNAPAAIIAGILTLEPASAEITIAGNAPWIPVVTKLPPNEILASTNTTGAVTLIDEDPTNPDANWITATDATAATDLRVGFEDPPPVSPPNGSQHFLLYLRKTTGTSDPTVDVELWQNGAYVSTLLNDTSITSTGGQLIDAAWNSSELSGTLDGTDVQCRVVASPGSGAVSGALPAYATAGTLFDNATMPQTNLVAGSASWSGGMPAHVAGDLLICLVLCRNADNNGLLSSVNGTGGTANWNLENNSGSMFGGSQAARIGFGWKVATSNSEVISITTSGGTTTDRIHARVYKFTAADGFATGAVANIGAAVTGTLSAVADMGMPTVAAGGANELALCLYGISVTSTIAAATGETGGNWTEPVGEDTGTNGCTGIQIADLSGGSEISGGTAAAGATSGVYVAVGMRLVPASSTANINTVEIGAIEWDALLGPRIVTLAGVAGDVTFSGQVPGLVRELVPAPGNVSITGQQAAVAALITPTSAVVEAVGGSTSLTFSLAPAVGETMVTGLSPSVAAVLSPAAAAVSIGGNAPSLTQYHEIVAASGAAEIAGQTAALTLTIQPSLSEISIAGNVPGLAIVILVEYAPSSGAVESSGNAPSMSLALVPSTGQISAAGRPAQVLSALVPSTAVVTVSGEIPTVGVAKIVEPDTAGVQLAGESPGLALELVAQSGGVTLVGYLSGLLLGLEPQPAAISLAGPEAELLAFAMHATADLDLAVQLNNVSITASFDLAVFTFNPFLEPPTGDYEIIFPLEDREIVLEAENRELDIPFEDREIIFPTEQREI